ncbi:MAG: glycosyltransferase family 2 protein [Planctomycetota bacterium]
MPKPDAISAMERALACPDPADAIAQLDPLIAGADPAVAAVARINRHVLATLQARREALAARPTPGERIVEQWDRGADAATPPVASVIMPTYNRDPAVLRDSVQSALRQDLVTHELIVVNDGGERTAAEAVLRPMHEADPRLRYIVAQHGGSASALNVGLHAARGRIIAYLDDDDRYHPHHLATACDALGDDDDGTAVLTQFAHVVMQRDGDGDGDMREWRETSRAVRYRATRAARGDYRWRMHAPNRGPIVHHRALLDRIGGGFCELVRYAEDWEFALRISRTAGFTGVDVVTGEFISRRGSQQKTKVRGADMVEDWNLILAHHGIHPLSGPVLHGRRGAQLGRVLADALEWHPDVIRALELRVLLHAPPWKLLRELGKLYRNLGDAVVARRAFAVARQLMPLFHPRRWLA